MNIILSPHFDDAVLSLGGLLAREGSNTLVATFFAGTPASPLITRWDTKCGFANSTHAMQERTKENMLSLGALGVTSDRILNYTHLDTEYRLANGESEFTRLEESIKKEILSLVQKCASHPTRVFMPGFESHPDHLLVKNAGIAAAQELLEKKPVQFFFYQDLPYAFKILERERSRFFWNFLTRRDPSSWNYALLEQSITHGSCTVSRHMIPLTSADMNKKIAGVELYKSQVTHLGEHFLETLKQFSTAQSHFFSLSAPYSELIYALSISHA